MVGGVCGRVADNRRGQPPTGAAGPTPHIPSVRIL